VSEEEEEEEKGMRDGRVPLVGRREGNMLHEV